MFQRIAIVGVGLIGGSIALAARRAWPSARIVGVDRADVLDAARAAGAVDGGAADLAAAGGADLIVLAAPVRRNVAVLRELAPSLGAGTTVTDVGSTKREIVGAARDLTMAASFVGGHPLAGAARGGFAAARADLFTGEPWLLTTPAPERALQRVEGFAAGLGAIPVRIPAETHDALIAFTSHLPQLAITALLHVVGSAVGEPGLALAGPGLRDSTRLASSPYDIWQDILASNAREIGEALSAYIAALEHIRAGLAPPASGAPQAPSLEDLFTASSRWKGLLDTLAKKPAL